MKSLLCLYLSLPDRSVSPCMPISCRGSCHVCLIPHTCCSTGCRGRFHVKKLLLASLARKRIDFITSPSWETLIVEQFLWQRLQFAGAPHHLITSRPVQIVNRCQLVFHWVDIHIDSSALHQSLALLGLFKERIGSNFAGLVICWSGLMAVLYQYTNPFKAVTDTMRRANHEPHCNRMIQGELVSWNCIRGSLQSNPGPCCMFGFLTASWKKSDPVYFYSTFVVSCPIDGVWLMHIDYFTSKRTDLSNLDVIAFPK